MNVATCRDKMAQTRYEEEDDDSCMKQLIDNILAQKLPEDQKLYELEQLGSPSDHAKATYCKRCCACVAQFGKPKEAPKNTQEEKEKEDKRAAGAALLAAMRSIPRECSGWGM